MASLNEPGYASSKLHFQAKSPRDFVVWWLGQLGFEADPKQLGIAPRTRHVDGYWMPAVDIVSFRGKRLGSSVRVDYALWWEDVWVIGRFSPYPPGTLDWLGEHGLTYQFVDPSYENWEAYKAYLNQITEDLGWTRRA